MNEGPPERGHWGWLVLAGAAVLVAILWVLVTAGAF